MSEVYQYHEKDEGKPNLMAWLIEGIRASCYARAKPTLDHDLRSTLPQRYSRLFTPLSYEGAEADVNPLHELCEQESISFGGKGGRACRTMAPDLDELMYNARQRINKDASTTLDCYRKRIEGITEWSDVREPGIARSRKKWDEMEPGVKSREPVPHTHTVDDLIIGFDPGVKQSALSIRDKFILFGPQEEASEQLFTTVVTPYLDPTDPDPLGTARAMQKVVLPDLKAMYAPDLDWYNKLQKSIIEAMGVPARFLEPVKKKPGIGRYYSESIGTSWPGYYSFEET